MKKRQFLSVAALASLTLPGAGHAQTISKPAKKSAADPELKRESSADKDRPARSRSPPSPRRCSPTTRR